MALYDLNIHQVIDQMPLPAADFETRRLLAVWARLPIGHEARDYAYRSLLHAVRLHDAPLADEILRLVRSLDSATRRKAPGIDQKKHGSGG